jgi:hypothetical protein
MKRFLFSIFVLSLSLNSYTQTQLSGSDFENWSKNFYNASFPSLFYWELEPTSIWSSPNEGVTIAGNFPTERTSDAQSGSYAARMETKSVFSVPAGGTLFTGYLIPNLTNTRAMLGVPFTDKPSSFNGYYKYTPAYYDGGQTIDSCAIYALLSYWDGNQRVTIAEASYYTSDTITNYTPFSIPFVYSLPNTPDTITVVFSSSKNGDSFVGGIGSTLYIDNISFDYSSSIEKPSEKIALKKRYLDENLLLDFEEAFSGKIRLFNTSAQEVYFMEIEKVLSHSIPLSFLSTGIYILEINSSEGKKYTDKIIRL